MSDTEEIIITKAPRAKKDTKPEIAREKLKEKRERLKKEKDDLLIEAAKKRLAEEQVQAAQVQKAEEEKKKSDPNFLLLQQMKEMMEMMKAPAPTPAPAPAPPVKKTRGRKKVEEVQEVQIPVAKEVKAPKAKAPPKPRKKVVYLDKPIVSPTTQFVGNDIFPTEDPPPRPPQSNLVNYLLSRRNLNTFVQ
jgi:hypothetical protein